MKVFCTNPTLTYSFGHLIDIKHHENEIPDGVIQKGQFQEFRCKYCQMPLVLNERYIPIQPLGAGGFGLTFLATDYRRGEDRVIKRLIARDGLGTETKEKIRALFVQEAEILEDLRHDQIPRLWDHFEVPLPNEDGDETLAYYLVQEFIDGRDLQKELQEVHCQGKKGFSEAEIIKLLQQILDVLKYIHKPRLHRSRSDGQRRTLIHRDIKPSNIMRGVDGDFYLIDFGSVKQVVQLGVPADQTIAVDQLLPEQPSTLTSVGTEAYCPYLQLHPRPGDRPEPWWDLYALATTCVKLLTGENPRGLGVPDSTRWQKLAQVDLRLAKILNRMMGIGMEPGQRYQDAAEVLQDLDALAGKPPTSSFNPRLAALIGGSVIAGALLLLGGMRLSNCNYSVGCLFGSSISHSDPNDAPKEIASKLLPAENLISAGEKQIAGSQPLSNEYETLKQQGIEQLRQENYRAAQESFSQIRKLARERRDALLNQTTAPEYRAAVAALQDPQVMIYGNNATARLRHQQGQPIYTIAVALPVSDKEGKDFPVGKQMLFGVAQAQKKAVEAGINLEMVIANDRNVPAQAEVVAKALTNWQIEGERRILAVVGHYTSPVTCTALPFYSAADVVVISPTSTLTNLRQDCQDSQQVFFRTSSSSAVEADTFVRYIAEKSQIADPKVAIFYNPNEGFSRDLTEQFERLFQGKGAIVQKIDLSDQNFNLDQALSDASSANIFAVFPDGKTENRGSFDRALEVLKTADDGRLIVGSNTLYQNEVLGSIKNGRSLAGKFLLAVDWHPQCSAEAFTTAYQSEWIGGVNRLTALSYEAVQVLAAAFQEGVSSSPALKSRLRTISTQSDVFTRKQLSFNADGNRRDITNRVLATPASDMNRFVLLDGETCP